MGLYEDMLEKTVETLALRELVSVPPERRVGEVVETLREKGLGCAIVVDSDGRPLGAFTERVLTHALSHGAISMDDRVGDHLEKRWAKVRHDEPIRTVVEAMNSEGVRFVCVTDEEGKAIALTGQKGLMEYVAEYFPTQVQNIVRRVGADVISQKREGA